MKIKNTHSKKIQDYAIQTAKERRETYFKAAYERIFLQGIKGGCEALSFAAPNELYQVFTLCRNLKRKYKKVYSVLYPEFMLFEKQYTSSGYWFSDGEAGKNERILAFLLCIELTNTDNNSIKQ